MEVRVLFRALSLIFIKFRLRKGGGDFVGGSDSPIIPLISERRKETEVIDWGHGISQRRISGPPNLGNNNLGSRAVNYDR